MAATRQFTATEALGPIFEDFLRPIARAGNVAAPARAPEADVLETEKDIQVMIDVPGLGPDDIELVLENNLLTVTGERRANWDSEKGRQAVHLAERRYGRFSRSFVLPRDVDQDGIDARFENGVLTVAIPKTERARRRRIQINGGGNQQAIDATPGVH